MIELVILYFEIFFFRNCLIKYSSDMKFFNMHCNTKLQVCIQLKITIFSLQVYELGQVKFNTGVNVTCGGVGAVS